MPVLPDELSTDPTAPFQVESIGAALADTSLAPTYVCPLSRPREHFELTITAQHLQRIQMLRPHLQPRRVKVKNKSSRLGMSKGPWVLMVKHWESTTTS